MIRLKMDKKENQSPQFGLCFNNKGYIASLEVGKVYCVIQDDEIELAQEQFELSHQAAGKVGKKNC